MKKLLATILAMVCLLLSACVLFACETDNGTVTNGEHNHTFESAWTYDDENHWHKATCEHTSEQGDKAQHKFVADGDSEKCSVCGYGVRYTATSAEWKNALAIANFNKVKIVYEYNEYSDSGKKEYICNNNKYAAYQINTDGSATHIMTSIGYDGYVYEYTTDENFVEWTQKTIIKKGDDYSGFDYITMEDEFTQTSNYYLSYDLYYLFYIDLSDMEEKFTYDKENHRYYYKEPESDEQSGGEAYLQFANGKLTNLTSISGDYKMVVDITYGDFDIDIGVATKEAWTEAFSFKGDNMQMQYAVDKDSVYLALDGNNLYLSSRSYRFNDFSYSESYVSYKDNGVDVWTKTGAATITSETTDLPENFDTTVLALCQMTAKETFVGVSLLFVENEYSSFKFDKARNVYIGKSSNASGSEMEVSISDNHVTQFKIMGGADGTSVTTVAFTYDNVPVTMPHNQLAYALKVDDTYELIGIGDCDEQYLEIPSTYNGKAVTSISGDTFNNCLQLVSLKLPDTITETPSLDGCLRLISLDLGNGVTTATSLSGNTVIKSIRVGKNFTGRIGGYGYSITNAVEIINDSDITIEYRDEEGNLLPVPYVHKGKSVIEKVGDFYFAKIDNSNYLLGYDGKSKDVILPDNYNGEKYSVFSSTVIIPSEVRYTTANKDEYIINLTLSKCFTDTAEINNIATAYMAVGDLRIPKNITKISKIERSIDKIYYEGTVAEWEQLEKEENWNESVYGTSEVICTDGTVQLHSHTFSDEWTYDDRSHWHEAICGDTDKISYRDRHQMIHDPDDQCKSICTICGYWRENHNYSDVDGCATPCTKCGATDLYHRHDIKYDNEYHWIEYTCEHKKGETEQRSAHILVENDDGKIHCRLCGYHIHTFRDTWTYDETHHWREAVCCDARTDYAEHERDKESNCCVVCKIPMKIKTRVTEKEWNAALEKELDCIVITMNEELDIGYEEVVVNGNRLRMKIWEEDEYGNRIKVVEYLEVDGEVVYYYKEADGKCYRGIGETEDLNTTNLGRFILELIIGDTTALDYDLFTYDEVTESYFTTIGDNTCFFFKFEDSKLVCAGLASLNEDGTVNGEDSTLAFTIEYKDVQIELPTEYEEW